jgi:hypothetical protein
MKCPNPSHTAHHFAVETNGAGCLYDGYDPDATVAALLLIDEEVGGWAVATATLTDGSTSYCPSMSNQAEIQAMAIDLARR